MNKNLAAGWIGVSLVLSLSAAGLSALTWQRAVPVRELPAADALAQSPDGVVDTEHIDVVNHSQGQRSLKSTRRLPKLPVTADRAALEAEAALEAKRLIELLPDNPMSLHLLAMLNAQLHHTAEAQELWSKCIELDPTAEPYYLNLAAIAIDRGESQLAVDTLRKAIAAGIESPDINHHLGVALNSIGESAEAAEIARATLAQHPNSGAHWFILGQALMQLGQLEEAEKSLKRAIELGGHNKAIYFALFNVCTRLGKKEEADEFRHRYTAFKEVQLSAEERYRVLSEAEARRICVSILLEAVALYRAIPDLEKAEHLLLRVLALDPEDLTACENLVEIYVESSEPGNEILMRQRITELNSTNLVNYLLLAKAHMAVGAPEEAEAQIKFAISLAPQMVTGYAAMADFLMERKLPSKAQWYVEQAILIKPTSQGFELLAKTLEAQGKTDESKKALEMAKLAAAQVLKRDSN